MYLFIICFTNNNNNNNNNDALLYSFTRTSDHKMNCK